MWNLHTRYEQHEKKNKGSHIKWKKAYTFMHCFALKCGNSVMWASHIFFENLLAISCMCNKQWNFV